jgi:ribosomal protein S18 acetylase RimI-like enzyme
VSEVIIRKFNIKDYPEIIALWDKVKLPYRPEGRDSYNNIKAQIANGQTIFLVAEVDGKPVGCVLGTHDGRKGWINRLAVEAAFRRRNIARSLVSELEGEFEKLGLEVFACVIETENEVSQEVFKRLGYEFYDVRYYSKRKTPKS